MIYLLRPSLVLGLLLLLSSFRLSAAAPDYVWAVKSTATDGVDSETIGTAAATDSSGNVYVTGLVTGPSGFGSFAIGGGTFPLLFLVKYTPAGEPVWVKTFATGKPVQCNAIAVDGNSVYVAGAASVAFHSSLAMLLLKYDTDGHPVWTNTAGASWTSFGSGPAASAAATSLSVDAAGNVYVGGSFTGQPAFAATNFTFSGIPFGHAGGGTFLSNNVPGNASTSDIFLAKFSSTGGFLWAKAAGGSNDDFGYGVAATANGNVWLTGSFGRQASFGDFSVVSTNEFIGDEGFIARYDGSGTALSAMATWGEASYKQVYAVAPDKGGGVFVAGRCSSGIMRLGTLYLTNTLTSPGFAGYTDTFLARLDSSGTATWAKLIDRQTAGFGKEKSAVGIAVDKDGNFLLTGSYTDQITFETTSLPSPSQPALFIASYNSSGGFQWATSALAERASGQEWAGGGTIYFIGNNIAADNAGNIYLTGVFRSDSGPAVFGSFNLTSHLDPFSVPSHDFFLTKLGSGGTPPKNPTIGSISVQPGGAVQLTLSVATGSVVVEHSLDLTAWAKFSTNNIVNGTVSFVDPAAVTGTAQFYRVSGQF